MFSTTQDMLREAAQIHNTAIALFGKKDNRCGQYFQKAEVLYMEVLATDYDNLSARLSLGTLYLQTGRNWLAVQMLEPLEDKTGNPKLQQYVVNNIAAGYRSDFKNDKAKEWYKKAIDLGDTDPIVLANLAALYVNEGEPQEGIPYGEKCLQSDPKHPQGRWNLGLLYLENEEWEKGFALYHQGYETGDRLPRNYKTREGKEVPYWEGESLDGKTIVFHGEQGIGDELLFLSFIPEFFKYVKDKKWNTEIILDIHPRLVDAVQRAFDVQVYATRKETPEWNEYTPVDYKQGLASLPKYVLSGRSKHSGYLKPKEDRAEFYKGVIQNLQARLGEEGKPVVGIAWTGGKKKTRVDLRSIPLLKLKEVLSQDATFVSLEYIPGAEREVSELYKETGIVLHHWPDVVEDMDYDETIALASACDLVISVNTSIIHVCGALGKNCWTMTPYGCAWRYGHRAKINPFWPCVKQYQQRKNGKWDRVLQKVTADLEKSLKEGDLC